MEFWQNATFCEPDQLLDVARSAEALGFDGILVADHVFLPEKRRTRYPYAPDGNPPFAPSCPWPDTWLTISAMAAATKRIRFASGVYLLPLRHPLHVAKAVGTAAVLSGNRVILGAGAGWLREEFDTLGIDFTTRGRRFDECIEVLHKLWKPGFVDHHGEFFDFDSLEMHPAPSRPVPIFVGGVSPAAIRRAGRLADGWLPMGGSPEELLARLEAVRAERVAAGRGASDFEVIASLKTTDRDRLRRFEEAGLTGIASPPFPWAVSPSSTLAEKEAYMERYASEVIEKLR